MPTIRFLRHPRADGRATYRVTVRHARGDAAAAAPGYLLVVDAPSRRVAGEAAEHAAEAAHGGMFEAISVRRAPVAAPADLTV
jgi:hypothetical protein